MLPAIGIIGAGQVGNALAKALHSNGYLVRAVWSRDPAHRDALALVTGAEPTESASDVISAADLTLVAISDDAITPMAETLAAHASDWRGKAVVHTSGAKSAQALQPLAALGVLVGSLHPAFPFAGQAVPAGITYAVEADDPLLRTWLRDLVAALSGKVIEVTAAQKARYHAALVIVSNYTVTLYDVALRLLLGMNADQDTAESALLALLQATAHNIEQFGLPDALTGPLVRADIETVSTHLDALSDLHTVRHGYLALAQLTLPMLRERGVDTSLIETLLNEKE